MNNKIISKRCDIGSPTKIRKDPQSFFPLRRTPVLKIQIGIDALNEMKENKEKVFEDDRLLINKISVLAQLIDEL